MTIELSRLQQLRKGYVKSLSVGPLHVIGSTYLRAETNDVRISQGTLLHIDGEHGDLSDFTIITIPYGLIYGMFISDAQKPSRLIVTYVYPDDNIRYKAVIKSANSGRELWLCTFYRMKPKQTQALLKRGGVIKTHK